MCGLFDSEQGPYRAVTSAASSIPARITGPANHRRQPVTEATELTTAAGPLAAFVPSELGG